LSEYARQIGKTQQYLSQLIAAAEVLEAVKSITQVMDFLDKANILRLSIRHQKKHGYCSFNTCSTSNGPLRIRRIGSEKFASSK